MGLIFTKVMVDTEESREWKKVNSDDAICPRDLLVTRPIALNADHIEALYPDIDKRITVVDCFGDNYYLVPVAYEEMRAIWEKFHSHCQHA